MLMTLLGGIGTTFGPVVGAIVVMSLEEFLAESGLPTQAIIGGIFVCCVLLFRPGIVGEIEHRLRLGPH
jgi:branched-chain amino acid transport system permease protein